MFCPSCGEHTSVEQKFCRSCGTKLERIWETLAEQSTVGAQMTAEAETLFEARTRRIERWRDGAFYLFLALIFGAVLWGVVYALMFKKGAILTGLGFLIFLFAAAATAILSAKLNELEEAKKKRSLAPATPALPETELNARRLSARHFEPAPSVTERTTELLRVESVARQRETGEV